MMRMPRCVRLLAERVQETVEHGSRDAVDDRSETDADGRALPGAQSPRAGVRVVAELADRGLHALARLGPHDVGGVEHVGDGLARDAGERGDILHGGQLCHAPTSLGPLERSSSQ